MKNKILVLGALMMVFAVQSCRKESDTLLAYDYNEYLSFGKGYSSFAGKYDIAWKALNQYYPIWDYERENGLDWDAAYEMYYPQFAALDKRGADNPVSNMELENLMIKAFGELHDGHIMITFNNHHNNNSPVFVSPSRKRIATRDDFTAAMNYKPNIARYYTIPANGEVEVDESGLPLTASYSTEVSVLMYNFMHTKGMGYMWICDEIDNLSKLTLPTAEQIEKLNVLKTLKEKLSDEKLKLDDYNTMTLQYAYLNIPGFSVINRGFANEGLSVRYALLKGNIPYLYFSEFTLSSYMIEERSQEIDQTDPNLQAHVDGIKAVWQAWFDAIQQLGKAGKLGGVIKSDRSHVVL